MSLFERTIDFLRKYSPADFFNDSSIKYSTCSRGSPNSLLSRSTVTRLLSFATFDLSLLSAAESPW